VGGEACHASVYSATNASQCASEYGASVEQRAYGLEGIFATGPFKLMGEFSSGDYKAVQGTNSTQYDTKTYYLEAGYFITGEKYAGSYKNGVFSSFKPNNDFDLDKGQWGAIELGLRGEAFEVDNAAFTTALTGTGAGRIQGSVRGTEAGAKTYTAGIRWILNPNMVIKANYAQTNFDYAFTPIDITSATAVVDKERMVTVRTQFMF
jgi:phosphate-selective porin OprO/OprP